MPEGFKDIETPLTSKELAKVMTKMAKTVSPEVYKESLKKLNTLGDDVASEYGGIASIHLSDVSIPPELKVMRDKLQRKVYQIAQRDDITSAQKKQLIISTVKAATPEIDKAVMDVLPNRDNSFGLLVGAGIKGKPQQLRQLVFGDLLTVDSKMRDIPYPTFRSYGEGITPMQYWTASHGGRYGYIQVQKATADAGYFSKQTRGVVHRQIITTEDCGAAKPYMVDAEDENSVGSLLFKDTKGKSGKVYPKDTIITEDILDDLKGDVLIRSAVCCGAGDGLCAKCAGVRESGRLSDIGDAVGLNGINASNEQITQSGLSSKHSGGESVSANRVKRGFQAIEQFINMPENFVGGASISPVAGLVEKVYDAPQGGKYVQINGTPVHVVAGFNPTVKQGDRIEAGDLISEGMPNIEKITEYKGIGEGRRAFVEGLYNVLQNNGGAVPKKQLEPFARAYIDKIEITDPDGVQGWIYGDIATYNKLAANWKPREGTVAVNPNNAVGKYLEMPALHYTIGTKVTGNVAKSLARAGIDSVSVNDKEPPFKPFIPSAKQFTATDEDWITALSGEGLTKSFIQHAQRGSDSNLNSTSYFPQLAFIGAKGEKPLTI
jgi:DNA-directed RNA polymerase subunit beta'